MARWREAKTPEMPEHLERFRPADWGVTAPEHDPWTAWGRHDRPRTTDPELLDAYRRFTDARAVWEAERPEWVDREIADMIARRLERAARWTRGNDQKNSQEEV